MTKPDDADTAPVGTEEEIAPQEQAELTAAELSETELEDVSGGMRPAVF